MWVVQDEGSGARAFSTLNEGPGRTFWFGVGDDEAVERARFLRDRAGPLLARLLERTGPIDVLDLAAQGLQMGDELHMRSQATTNLLWRRLLPAFAAEGGEDVAAALTANHLFFLNLVMAAAKCASLAAAGATGSTLVTLMSRNGTDMGLQLAGLPGRWFTAPAAPVQDALLREGFAPDDAALDIGDSAVLECIGLGGMAVAAAPAVAAFFGGGAADAAARSRLMGEICAGRSARFTLPALDHAGSPVGIDARLVVELGVAPQITTGVLHATQGAGQIGAGIAHQPLEPFRDALAALVEELEVSIDRRGDRRARARAPARAAGARSLGGPDADRPATASSSRSRRPGRRGCPTRSRSGPGPTVVWDPVVAPIEPGPALAARGARDPARAGRRATRRGRGRRSRDGRARARRGPPSRRFRRAGAPATPRTGAARRARCSAAAPA